MFCSLLFVRSACRPCHIRSPSGRNFPGFVLRAYSMKVSE